MTASILLVETKFPHNVGGAVRALSCFGGGEVFYTGDRFDMGDRLPREERMRAYKDTPWYHMNELLGRRPVDFVVEHTPGIIAVELLPGTEPLHTFEHPKNALYVFGPEDGSLPNGIRRSCHRFVTIPSFHCLNLAAAVYIVLYDRAVKRWQAELDEMPSIDGEGRGYWHTPHLEEADHHGR
jgi:tRNA(Leu) C34 or U34 (ribose-2'-O)-methylase TrmL